MDQTFSVTCHGRQVGHARIHREGLYCRVTCTCETGDGSVYILYGAGDGDTVRFGVPVPRDGVLYLETRIPVKRFPQRIEEMYLVEKGKEKSDTGVLLKEGAPVAGLEKLMGVKLKFTPDGPALISDGINPHK